MVENSVDSDYALELESVAFKHRDKAKRLMEISKEYNGINDRIRVIIKASGLVLRSQGDRVRGLKVLNTNPEFVELQARLEALNDEGIAIRRSIILPDGLSLYIDDPCQSGNYCPQCLEALHCKILKMETRICPKCGASISRKGGVKLSAFCIQSCYLNIDRINKGRMQCPRNYEKILVNNIYA